MLIFNSLLISILLVGWDGTQADHLPAGDCANFAVEQKVDQPQIGEFTVSINPKGGKTPYKIVLSEEFGQLVSEDFSKTKFEGLKKGKYICVVVDANKCLIKTEINVQP